MKNIETGVQQKLERSDDVSVFLNPSSMGRNVYAGKNIRSGSHAHSLSLPNAFSSVERLWKRFAASSIWGFSLAWGQRPSTDSLAAPFANAAKCTQTGTKFRNKVGVGTPRTGQMKKKAPQRMIVYSFLGTIGEGERVTGVSIGMQI